MSAKKMLYVIMAVIGLALTILSVIQLIMAISFGELGRVVFYAVCLVVGVELTVYAIYKLVKSANLTKR